MKGEFVMAVSEKVRRYAEQLKKEGISPQEFVELVRLLQEHFKIRLVLECAGTENDSYWKDVAAKHFLTVYADEDAIYDQL